MLTSAQRENLINQIYQIPELTGVMIGYYHDGMCEVLSPGFMVTDNFFARMLILEEGGIDESLVRGTDIAVEPVQRTEMPAFVSNRSAIGAELTGAGLACGFTIIAAAGVVAGAAAEVPTAGASTILVYASWIGMVTSGIQCVNGVARAAAAISAPDDNTLQRWDANEWYTGIIFTVDLIGVVSSLVSLPAATRNLLAILERRSGQAALRAAVERASREERRRLIQEAMRQATRTADGAAEVRAALEAARLTGRQAAQVIEHGAGTARRARIVAGALSEVTGVRLFRTCRDVLGGVGGIVASATPSSLTGSASGSVNTIGSFIIHAMAR